MLVSDPHGSQVEKYSLDTLVFLAEFQACVMLPLSGHKQTRVPTSPFLQSIYHVPGV